jgi:hypothetical protein
VNIFKQFIYFEFSQNHSKDLNLIWISKLSIDLFFNFLVLSPWFKFQTFKTISKSSIFEKVPKTWFDFNSKVIWKGLKTWMIESNCEIQSAVQSFYCPAQLAPGHPAGLLLHGRPSRPLSPDQALAFSQPASPASALANFRFLYVKA